VNEHEALIARVPLFEPLSEEEIHYLATTLRVCNLSPGEILFQEGDVGDSFYVVITGQLEILKALGTVDERVLTLRGPGEYVGEMSLFSLDGLRTAAVRARSIVQLWELTRPEFNQLLHRQPMIAYTMVRVLSNRLNDSHVSSMAELQAKNHQLVKAYEELKAAQEQIIEKEKLERELQVAYEIQMSILPQTLPVMKGFDFGARIVPARAVGGDFYDFFPLDGHKIGILVGDVTDKGVPAAIFMAQTHALLRAEASHHTSPREVLLSANHHILNRNEKGLFVTVLYGILDWSTRCFTYARAGHELPILSVPGAQPAFAPKNPGQPLGILERPLLDEQTLTIPPGGRLLLYTDGITDERNPQGESFGFERLMQAVGSAGGLSAQDSCDMILNTVIDFLNCTPQFDDVTMVVIHSH